jgi:hypothetical protein
MGRTMNETIFFGAINTFNQCPLKFKFNKIKFKLLFSISSIDATKDYYKILNVPK